MRMVGRGNRQEEKSRPENTRREEEEERTSKEERDVPRARSQAASSQPDVRSTESKLFRRKER